VVNSRKVWLRLARKRRGAKRDAACLACDEETKEWVGRACSGEDVAAAGEDQRTGDRVITPLEKERCEKLANPAVGRPTKEQW
jgi:hypothetical protein